MWCHQVSQVCLPHGRRLIYLHIELTQTSQRSLVNFTPCNLCQTNFCHILPRSSRIGNHPLTAEVLRNILALIFRFRLRFPYFRWIRADWRRLKVGLSESDRESTWKAAPWFLSSGWRRTLTTSQHRWKYPCNPCYSIFLFLGWSEAARKNCGVGFPWGVCSDCLHHRLWDRIWVGRGGRRPLQGCWKLPRRRGERQNCEQTKNEDAFSLRSRCITSWQTTAKVVRSFLGRGFLPLWQRGRALRGCRWLSLLFL